MGSEKAAETTVQSAQVNGGVGTSLNQPDLDQLIASVRQGLEQLPGQRDQLLQTLGKLEAELAAQRAAIIKLQAERDKYRELARVYIEIAYPMEQVIRDFENMPPLEELHTMEDLLKEMELLQKNLAVQKSA